MTSRRWRRLRPLIALTIIGVVAVGVGLAQLDAPTRRLAAQFSQVVGVHPGSDVRVLGVRVGEVVAVQPRGRTVQVRMRYDADFRLPADVRAVVVPPSIVSDRYVQLAPAYTGGPALADGADLPVGRTAVPLELDDIYRSLDGLNRALGPNGANADGALSDLVGTARKNLEGNGAPLHDTLDGLATALSTVADGRADLFGTVDNLQRFTTALARSDQQVREFNQRLASVSELLAAERDELAAALRSLSRALADITAFVRDNRSALAANVEALADISGVLVRQQKAVMEVLDVAPLALSNLNLTYNARSGTLDTRDNALGPYDPASFVCAQLAHLVAAPKVPQECLDLATLLKAEGLPLPGELLGLLGLGGGTPRGGTPAAPQAPDTGDNRDLTLGGILRGVL